MLFNYGVTSFADKKFNFQLKINENCFFNYDTESYFYKVSLEEKTLICYGYCFDVRFPDTDIEQTLEEIIKSESILNETNYLNGQFIIILKENEEIYLTVDATALLDVFVAKDFNILTSVKSAYEDIEFNIFNPNTFLNFTTKTVDRIDENLSFEINNVENQLINLIKNQYKYFNDKNLIVKFKANNFTKSVIAMLHPVLFNNHLHLSSNEINPSDKKFGKLISNEYKMKYFESNIEDLPVVININKDNLYFVKNQLIDLKLFSKNTKQNVLKNNISKSENLSELEKQYEYNIVNRKKGLNENLMKNVFVYEPFNVRAIQYIFRNIVGESKINISKMIIDNLHPSLYYYLFSKKNTLREENIKLNKQIENIQNQLITSDNEQFLINTKMSNFKVSDNLDGKLKSNEILVYPSTQNIHKEDIFKVKYQNTEDGLIQIESFIRDKKLAKTIELKINNQKYYIDDFLNGVLFNIDSTLNIELSYKRNYNSLNHQKASMLLIRKLK